MIINCNTIVDGRDHVQYLTVSKSYSDNCICSLTEQNTTLKKSVLWSLFVCLVLNDASTLVSHWRQTVSGKHDGDGKSKNLL